MRGEVRLLLPPPFADVAQLERARVPYTRCRRFESSRPHQRYHRHGTCRFTSNRAGPATSANWRRATRRVRATTPPILACPSARRAAAPLAGPRLARAHRTKGRRRGTHIDLLSMTVVKVPSFPFPLLRSRRPFPYLLRSSADLPGASARCALGQLPLRQDPERRAGSPPRARVFMLIGPYGASFPRVWARRTSKRELGAGPFGRGSRAAVRPSSDGCAKRS